ncbi:unnamed protein product [Linum tenue]|uniref:H15 domain-containing protein n=1 Tax=Linum tenue TaxID=586396 RepID=A0AAV0LH84_9ROSI|nr:unnamed protein product [Linum tenue]
MAETEPAVVAAVPAAEAKSKAKKPAVKKPRAARNYPSFEEQMISDAIVALKERTGSSQIAITKYIEDKHKNLPPNFRKMLLFQLKRLVAAEKLVKVKASFKLPSGRSASPPLAAAVAKKPAAAAAKPKAAAAKPKAATTKVAVKPKAKTAAKPKPKAAAKPTAAAAKPAAKVQPKRKATAPAAKPVAKKAKLAKAVSPGKKKAAPKPKKAAPKPKSVKSPIKKAAGTKRTRK